MRHARRPFLFVVAHQDNRRLLRKKLQQVEYLFAVFALETLRRFIEQQHLGWPNRRTRHENNALIDRRQITVASVNIIETKIIEPFLRLRPFFPGGIFRLAEIRRKARAQHLGQAQVFTILERQFRREKSEFSLVFPDIQAMPRALAQKRDIVLVNLGVVRREHTEERTLAACRHRSRP